MGASDSAFDLILILTAFASGSKRVPSKVLDSHTEKQFFHALLSSAVAIYIAFASDNEATYGNYYIEKQHLMVWNNLRDAYKVFPY